MVTLIILIVIVILLIAALPTYPYSRNWGYAPGSTIAVIFIILLLLYLLGIVRF
jgi:uncharacterized protein DUF3309